jgi:cysteine-rich repeat protein
MNSLNVSKIFLFLVGILFLAGLVSAGEGCYVKINFNEQLVGYSMDSVLSFSGLNNLYGNYGGLVSEYSSSVGSLYTIKIFSSEGLLYGMYSFGSGVMFNGEGSSYPTAVVVPYFSSMSSAEISINGEKKLDIVLSGVACERDCLLAGEFSSIDKRCCGGLVKSWKSPTNLTCVSCGDGVCSSSENYFLCSVDCVDDRNIVCANGKVKGKYGCVDANVVGNGIVESGEQCDDGNLFNVDGCGDSGKKEYCIDLDESSGLDSSIFISSKTFGSGDYFYDSCLDSRSLREYYCGYGLQWDFWNMHKVAKSSIVECEFGCSMGACLEESAVPITTPDCIDSDGEDYFVNGYVQYDGMYFADVCFNETTVNEYVCGASVNNKYYDCPAGCSDGVCIMEVLDLPPEPENPEKV